MNKLRKDWFRKGNYFTYKAPQEGFNAWIPFGLVVLVPLALQSSGAEANEPIGASAPVCECFGSGNESILTIRTCL